LIPRSTVALAGLLLACVPLGCGGQVDALPSADGGVEAGLDAAPDIGIDSGSVAPPDAGSEVAPPPPWDAGPCSVATPPKAATGCGPDGPDPSTSAFHCGPSELGDSTCGNTTPVATCPTDTACMAARKQTGPKSDYRLGRLEFAAPTSLISLEGIAFTPFVNPTCVDKTSGEGLNLLLRIDRSSNTIQIGGAARSADHATFSFLGTTFDPSGYASVCPATASAPGASFALTPASSCLSWSTSGTSFSTGTIAALNIPVYDTPSGPPMILPLREASLQDVTVSPDGNCIGSWQKPFFCGMSVGWTTDGAILGKIGADDADRIVIKKVGCQSLCALLVNDSSKTDSTGHCRKDASGAVIAGLGDTCVGGTGCKNAFQFTAAFAAYGVTISP
jgi:hypothetical protein